MDVKQVKDKVFEMIALSSETEVQINEETSLYEDIDLASIEVYVLLHDLEKEFGAKIPAEELRKVYTAGDLYNLVISYMELS